MKMDVIEDRFPVGEVHCNDSGLYAKAGSSIRCTTPSGPTYTDIVVRTHTDNEYLTTSNRTA
jgi:hypothetical protein